MCELRAHALSQLETVRGCVDRARWSRVVGQARGRAVQRLLDLPGGFLEAGEHPIDGMFREVREETGLDVRVIELLGVYIDRYDNNGDEIFTLNHYYVVEPIGGELRAADDVDAFHWFALDALPAQIAFEHARVVLSDLREWMKREA